MTQNNWWMVSIIVNDDSIEYWNQILNMFILQNGTQKLQLLSNGNFSFLSLTLFAADSSTKLTYDHTIQFKVVNSVTEGQWALLPWLNSWTALILDELKKFCLVFKREDSFMIDHFGDEVEPKLLDWTWVNVVVNSFEMTEFFVLLNQIC